MPEASTEVVELPNAGWDARLHVFRSRSGEVDTFAIATARCLVVIDTTTLPALSARIVERLRPLLAGRQLLVVNTHADYDHAWGNATFAPDGAFPAPIIGHELARERLLGEAAQQELARKHEEDSAFDGMKLVPPTLTFRDGLRIDGGDLSLELLPTPGHTPDHISVWVSELRLLLAGDAAEQPFPYVEGAAQIPVLRASLARLAALHPALVLPCHGGTTDPGLLARNLAYFDALERHARTAVAAGTVPANWSELDDLPDALGFPYLEALQAASAPLESLPESLPELVPAFYRAFHLANMRAMLGWVLSPPEATVAAPERL